MMNGNAGEFDSGISVHDISLLYCLIQTQIARRTANTHRALASCNRPILIFGRPVLKLARSNMERDGLAFVGSEVNAIESDQCANRELHAFRSMARRTKINLRHFVGGNSPLVLDVHFHIKAAVRRFRHTQGRSSRRSCNSDRVQTQRAAQCSPYRTSGSQR